MSNFNLKNYLSTRKSQLGNDVEEYLQKVGQDGLLFAQEEREFISKAQQGDTDAIEKIVAANLRFLAPLCSQQQVKLREKFDVDYPSLKLLQMCEKLLVVAAVTYKEKEEKFINYAVGIMRDAFDHFSNEGSLLENEDVIIAKTYHLTDPKVLIDGVDINVETLVKFRPIVDKILFDAEHGDLIQSLIKLFTGNKYHVVITHGPTGLKEYEFTWSYEGSEEIKKTYLILPLGEYDPIKKQIFLYYHNIVSEAQELNIPKETLMQIVFLHETGHALMDAGNNDSRRDFYRFWKEESYANAFALKMLKDYGDKALLDCAVSFMNRQSDPYKYGVTVFNDNDFGFLKWKEDKKCGRPTMKERNEWLKAVGAI